MKKRKDKNLAEGEVTGHAHRCIGDCEVYDEQDGSRTLIVNDNIELTHEEHNTLTIPAGRYKTFKAIEYNHAEEEAKEVQD
jgi:hypothetical protein